MDSNDVTLTIPCFNAEDTLPSVLEAVNQLDPAPATVLCIDDGSTDSTKRILEDCDGIGLISHDRNRGLASTLNTALSHTTTPFLAKVDADVLVPPDWLERIGREMDESRADLVQGRFVEQTTTLGDQWRENHTKPEFYEFPWRNKPINGSNIIADVSALRDVDGWNEQYRRANDDIDLCERLIDAGYEVYYAPSIRPVHVRTDTWKDALRTAWAYTNYLRFEGKPTDGLDVLRRLPTHVYLWGGNMILDIWRGHFEIVWISFLRLLLHVKWDVECVQNTNP